MDVHSPAVRSRNMSRIRSKNTKPEISVRMGLHAKGLRYSLNNNQLPGKPDVVFRRFNVVLFVNGCFWHGHEGCDKFRIPKTRREWWMSKINKTKSRDKKAICELRSKGWRTLTVWECQLNKTNRSDTIETLFRLITSE